MDTRSRIFFPVVFFACAFFAAGCVQPLGPGFRFADRQTEIRVSEGTPGRIHFHVVDELENAGDRPLHSLDVRLPEGSAFGAQNMSVQIDGVEISPQHSSAIDSRMMSAAFDPTWKRNEGRTIISEWDLMPESSERGTIAASADGFFIADETALPLWQTPKSVFARGGSNPAKELLTIYAPQDFRVLAPGKPFKRDAKGADGGEAGRRFLIDPDRDPLPYVVAGRYQEKVVRSRDGQVRFWTFQPLAGDMAQMAADRLSSSMKALTEFFGPVSSGEITVRIAESPVELAPEFGAIDDPGGVSFPEGALLDSRTFQQGIANEAVLQLTEYELARTWFGWRVRPTPAAQILMGRGAGLFGLVIAAENRGQDERRRMIASFLQRYDEAREIAPDRRLMEPPAGYSHDERISTGYRAALFFVALEDFCGRDNLKTALRDIIHDRSGSDTSYEDLRAAAESASGKDLAEMFRVWLVQPGLPDEFRARYRTKAQARLRN